MGIEKWVKRMRAAELLNRIDRLEARIAKLENTVVKLSPKN